MSAELVKKLIECQQSLNTADTQRCYEDGQDEFVESFHRGQKQLAACLDLALDELGNAPAPSAKPSPFVNEPKVEFLGPE